VDVTPTDRPPQRSCLLRSKQSTLTSMGDAIPFRPFSRNRPSRVYHSHRLPHWRQDGCTYFVTFRLADSLPAAILQRIEQDRMSWLKLNGNRIEDLSDAQKQEYLRLYSTALERSLDKGHGSSLLKSPEIRMIVAKALEHFDQQKARIGNFVIMPNHVHVLMTPFGKESLEQLLKSIHSHPIAR